jgi:Tol biopolymer transport system component
MDADRWRRVDEIFTTAVELPPERRAELLDQACGDDSELRAQVERMLAADRDDGFLESHASGEAARAVAAAARVSLVGRRLGPYEIVAPLGAGGMGEVYRARDTRLDRPVAVKVMPPHLAADPEARQRFDREARAISNLAHPHICALHDVGSDGGVDYLVMELVEGETLAARVERGPVPLADALRWAAQIAGALDRAHRSGIVHRDLKPGNVMLTRGGVKLLDFGLARRTAPVRVGSLSGRPTRIAEPLTAEGTILGTLHYMAPEQLEGRPVDQRADIFAFGAMLYEMVTGRRAFEGDSPASVVSAILRDRPPPVSARVPVAPPALDALVEHCLAKDVEDRWQSAHDLQLQLAAIAAEDPARAAKPAAVRGRWLPWAVAGLAAAVALVAGWQALRRPAAASPPAVRFELPHPTGGRFYYSVESVTMALSPDGRLLAFVSLGPTSTTTSIWIRALEELEARPLAGTEGAGSLFWSPDGQHVGFVADAKLKRVPIAGGSPVVLCDVELSAGVSATWGRDSILFASVQGSSILGVPAGGGRPVTVLSRDEARGDLRLVWPWFLPDGERFLYLVYRADGTSELRLAGGGAEPRAVTALTSRVELVDPGHLVFVREGALLAQAFDADRAELVGEPIALAPVVRGFGSTGVAAFATSRRGAIALATQEDVHRLTLHATDGRPLGSLGQPGAAASMALSPDRRRVAVDRLRPGLLTYDLWLVDLERGVETRLTDGPGTEVYPVWLRGGGAVAYASTRGHVPNILRRDLGSGREAWLTPPAAFQIPVAATPDGTSVLYRQRRTDGFELRSVPVDGGPSTPVLRPGVSAVDAALSPDGRLLVYVAREGARFECFLRPLRGGESVRVSRNGAFSCRFSPDGKTIFLTTGDRWMAAVSVTAKPFGVGAQRDLFALTGLGWNDFEVLEDGRFLALVREVDAMTAPLTVIAGWRPGG